MVNKAEDAEESKDEGEKAKKKNGTSTREPLEKEGQYESKGTVSKSKLANKRSQKEAIKKNKVKREKGTLKDGPSHQ